MNKILCTIIIILVVGLGTIASAEITPRDAFPHVNPVTGRLGVHPVNTMIGALQAFYEIHGHWPSKWSSLVDEGLFQVPLFGFNDEVIDPDDGELGFYGDVRYAGSDENGLAQIAFSFDAFSHGVKIIPVHIPRTYADYFARKQAAEIQSKGCSDYNYVQWLADKNMIKLFAIIRMMDGDLTDFNMIHNKLPDSLAEFVDSGLTPVDWNSINPFTGEKFKFDGSPGDIHYKNYSDEERLIYELCFVNEEGELIRFMRF